MTQDVPQDLVMQHTAAMEWLDEEMTALGAKDDLGYGLMNTYLYSQAISAVRALDELGDDGILKLEKERLRKLAAHCRAVAEEHLESESDSVAHDPES